MGQYVERKQIKIRDAIRWRLFSYRQRFYERQDRAFDRAHQVETAGDVWLSEAGVDAENVLRGNSVYRPIRQGMFSVAMQQLEIDFGQFCFVDYGSGKGKALFLAASYPFKKIIGVEYAPLLHEVAKRNLEAYRDPGQRCFDLSVVHGDAMDYEPPELPLVCSFFNPFDDQTLTKVLSRLRQSLVLAPRRIYLIYGNPRNVREHSAAFTADPDVRVLVRRRKLLLCAYEKGS